jgi:exopolyphosphatase/guanosine-5'-triphosphate,3'-diphosphate pyrophosphatase
MRGVRRNEVSSLPLTLMVNVNRIAAIDLGSLTVRLAVAETTGPGRFRLLTHRREITGLGQGLAQTGNLDQEAMARTLLALKGFLQEIQALEIERCQAVATQAVRQARNREEFLHELRDFFPFPVHLVSPEEEAKLTLKGVLAALDPRFLKDGPVVVIDLGGGSSEFILVRPESEPLFTGLPLGVLTLSQARPVGDPPEPDKVAALGREIREGLGAFCQTNLAPHLSAPPTLVGTAGAVTTLAAVALNMTDYDPQRVNNLILSKAQVEELASRIIGLPEAERARLPGLEAAKAGVMVAGVLIVLNILEIFRQGSLVVIDAGLLEGVLTKLAA